MPVSKDFRTGAVVRSTDDLPIIRMLVIEALSARGRGRSKSAIGLYSLNQTRDGAVAGLIKPPTAQLAQPKSVLKSKSRPLSV